MSCERYFGFGCELDEETSNKLEGMRFSVVETIFCLILQMGLVLFCVLLCYILLTVDFLFYFFILNFQQACRVFCLCFLTLMLTPKTKTMAVSWVDLWSLRSYYYISCLFTLQ